MGATLRIISRGFCAKTKQLILPNDPFVVLEANQIVGNILPNAMDSKPGRLGQLSRLLTIETFGSLYCNRFNLLTETMTCEEVSKNIECWDKFLGPGPKNIMDSISTISGFLLASFHTSEDKSGVCANIRQSSSNRWIASKISTPWNLGWIESCD